MVTKLYYENNSSHCIPKQDLYRIFQPSLILIEIERVQLAIFNYYRLIEL